MQWLPRGKKSHINFLPSRFLICKPRKQKDTLTLFPGNFQQKNGKYVKKKKKRKDVGNLTEVVRKF